MGRNLFICLFIVSVISINATIITEWNFESESLNPSTGSGTVSRIGGVAHDTFNDGYDDSEYAWSTTSYPAQSTNNLSGGIKIEVSTIGYTDIYFSWVTRHSNTSANREVLFYTLDKTAVPPVWIQAGVYNAASGDDWFARSFDGRSIPGLNNNANLAFKIVSAFSNAANTAAFSNLTFLPN